MHKGFHSLPLQGTHLFSKDILLNTYRCSMHALYWKAEVWKPSGEKHNSSAIFEQLAHEQKQHFLNFKKKRYGKIKLLNIFPTPNLIEGREKREREMPCTHLIPAKSFILIFVPGNKLSLFRTIGILKVVSAINLSLGPSREYFHQ